MRFCTARALTQRSTDRHSVSQHYNHKIRRRGAQTWCCRRVRPRIQRIWPRGVRSSTVSSSGSGCLSLSSISCLSAAPPSLPSLPGSLSLSVGTLVTSCGNNNSNNNNNNYKVMCVHIVQVERYEHAHPSFAVHNFYKRS